MKFKIGLIVLNSFVWTLLIISSFTYKKHGLIEVDKNKIIDEKLQEIFRNECILDSLTNVL